MREVHVRRHGVDAHPGHVLDEPVDRDDLGDVTHGQAEGVAGFDKVDGELYANVLAETRQNVEALKLDLAPYIDRAWDEVSPIERCILLLGACELRLHPETPYRVIINEAIELAKTFGGTDGHKFVNGVLDKLAAVLRPSEIQKR